MLPRKLSELNGTRPVEDVAILMSAQTTCQRWMIFQSPRLRVIENLALHCVDNGAGSLLALMPATYEVLCLNGNFVAMTRCEVTGAHFGIVGTTEYA